MQTMPRRMDLFYQAVCECYEIHLKTLGFQAPKVRD